MKHKGLAILLCLAMVLTMALPGTLAVSADEDSNESQLTMETCTCGAEDDIHAEDCPLYVQPEPSEEETVCTCGAEEGDHAEDCPKYVQPEPSEEESVCTCGTEDDIHAEDCPLYKISGDGETDSYGAPSDSERTEADLFYDAVMMAESTEKLETLLSQYSTEEINTLLDSMDVEKQNAIYTHVAELYPSETVPDYSGVAATNAAPFLEPVQIASFFSARAADQEESGLILDKNATYDAESNTVKISLEAFVTGEVTISDIETAVPTDIVLVLDSSGSMDDYITIGDKNDLSVLDTKYGGEDGMYELDDKVIQQAWPNMVYKDGKWYYHKWQVGLFGPTYLDELIEVGSEENYSTGINIRIKKINALKIAAQRFVDQVNAKNTDANGNVIGHQIAVVDFDSSGTTVIGLTSVATGETTIKNAIKGLDAQGATGADYGMTRATEILNTIPATRKSNRVVIMFTDGEPNHQSGFDTTVANSAIKTSKEIKNTYGATVYTIGVFDSGKLDTTVPMPDNASNLNKYMHYVSSNFKNAESMTNGGAATYPKTGSYYLGATDATQLNEIFKSISDQIQTGGASISLDASTVVKDVVTPQFTAPTDSREIQIYTAPYQGYDADGERDFGDKVKSNLTATIAEDGSIQVSGFDFSSDENCVTDTTTNGSTTYSGNKLIIEFTVGVKEGFLGGNDVYTNAEANVTNGDFSQNFPEPTVNIPIKEITIDASDKNVYLTQVPTEEQLKSDVTIKCGDVDITDPSKLADWQKAYVDIDRSFTNAEDFNATTDGTYTVTATVSPETTGDSSKPGTVATAKTGTETKNINVFKPELTYKDSEVYYGDNVPTSYDSNLSKTEWKHGETLSTAVTMVGTAPTLDLTYTPDSTKIENGKINSKSDIAVDVAVKIGATNVANHTTFQHTDCTGKTCGKPGNGKFWLHVNTCQLTITKTGGATDESYVFDVYKDGKKYTEVTVWGNGSETIYELPVGSYTIKENTGWSWRYTANNGSAATLSAQTPSGSITCTNKSTTDKWLNGFSTIVKNIYGVAKTNASN